MKKSVIFSTIISLAVGLSSCSETYLELNDPNKLTANDAWGSQEGVEAGLTGAYHQLYNSFYTNLNAYMCSGQSDEFMSDSPDNELKSLILLNYTNYDQRWNLYTYNLLYQAIFRANQVIVHAEEIEWKSDKEKTDLLAQARALRGMHYYYLTMLYKKAPIVDWISSPADQPEESTFEKNCEFTEKDLKFAAENLPDQYKEIGRVNRYMALCFLGKLYMNTGHYAEAKDCFKQVINSKRYSLVANYRDNFRHDSENNSESIFETQNSDESPNKFGGFWGMVGNDGADCNYGNWRERFMAGSPAGFNDYYVPDWVISMYKEETTRDGKVDVRLRDNLVYPDLWNDFPGEILYPGDGQITEWRTDLWQNKAWCRKYCTDYYNDVRQATNPNAINVRILRYADVLLSYAECMARTGEPIAEAAKYVDMVRERVNLLPLKDSVHKDCLNDVKSFMRRLHWERCKELFAEYDRFFDLRRWGLGTDSEYTNFVKSYSVKHDLYFVPGHEWLPFPQKEINNNPNLTQNESF